MLAFDVQAPQATVAGLLVIGVMTAWPRWWVAVCSMLCLLVALLALATSFLVWPTLVCSLGPVYLLYLLPKDHCICAQMEPPQTIACMSTPMVQPHGLL
jgi:hypothetical protein